ncbi:MAG: hypothetical protein ABIE84_02485 [bacterium]
MSASLASASIQNRSLRLGRISYNAGSPQRAIKFLRNALKVAQSVEEESESKQLIVEAYYDLICQLHIECIELYAPNTIYGISSEAEMTLFDAFQKFKPGLKYSLISKYYYFQGRFFTLIRNRAKANESYVNSLAYNPTNHKSLLGLVNNVVTEFPEYSAEILNYIQTFAGVVPEIKDERLYRKIFEDK